MAYKKAFEPTLRLSRQTLRCKTKGEIIEALRKLGYKAAQISGRPGSWDCLISSPDGRAIQKNEIRVSIFAPTVPVGIRGASGTLSELAVPAHVEGDLDAMCDEEGVLSPSVGEKKKGLNRLLHLMMLFACRCIGFVNLTNGIPVYRVRRVLTYAAAVGLGAAALSAPKAEGASMAISPVQSNSANFYLDVGLTNDDNGVVYNSASTDIVSTLAQDIYALGNSGESSVNDMINNEWGISIRGSPAGEVQGGWDAQTVGLGTIDLNNDGGSFMGIPTYDTWQNTNSNASQDTMALRFTVPNYLLDTDGTAGYNALTDHTIGIDSVSQANMFTGSEGGVTYSTPATPYELNAAVPEPSTAALAGLGGLALLLHRKRK